MANEIALIAQEATDNVAIRINELVGNGIVKLPEGYSATTALKSAALVLQDLKDKNGNPVLDKCTKSSIYNALLDMCIQGLQPTKKQCYFIPYGNQLSLFRSYFGTVCALKLARTDVYKIVTDLVKEGDEVEFATTDFGERYIKRIVTDPVSNISKPVVYGFCNIFDINGNILGNAIMTWADIQKSWRQSRMYGGENSTHAKFPEEMAKRTLIARACKHLLNESTDSEKAELYAAINRTTDSEFKQEIEEQNAQPVEKKTRAEQMKERFHIGEQDKSQEPVEVEPVTEPDSFVKEEDDFPFEPTNESNSEGLF